MVLLLLLLACLLETQTLYPLRFYACFRLANNPHTFGITVLTEYGVDETHCEDPSHWGVKKPRFDNTFVSFVALVVMTFNKGPSDAPIACLSHSFPPPVPLGPPLVPQGPPPGTLGTTP